LKKERTESYGIRARECRKDAKCRSIKSKANGLSPTAAASLASLDQTLRHGDSLIAAVAIRQTDPSASPTGSGTAAEIVLRTGAIIGHFLLVCGCRHHQGWRVFNGVTNPVDFPTAIPLVLGYCGHGIGGILEGQMIRAELIKSETASACGLVAKGGSPVIKLCQMLVAAGHDPSSPMQVYRGDTLALKVRSIGEAAGLVAASNGYGFARAPAMRTAAPMRSPDPPAVSSTRPTRKAHRRGCDQCPTTSRQAKAKRPSMQRTVLLTPSLFTMLLLPPLRSARPARRGAIQSATAFPVNRIARW
jgi:hypothetical protein